MLTQPAQLVARCKDQELRRENVVVYLGVPIRRNEVIRQRVPIAEFADGTPVTVPVVTMGGADDGPTLYLQAGIHGDELTGIEICRRAVQLLATKELVGNVVAVPVANVPAHLTRTRGYLNEEPWLIDMNRFWPGVPTGLLTERIAHLLFTEFVQAADFTIDLHSALDGCDISPFVYVWPDDNEHGTLEARERYAQAFGTPYIYYHSRGTKFGTSQVESSLAIQADLAGSAMMLAEMGESRRVSTEFVSAGVQGVCNVLVAMGILQEEPQPARSQRRFTKFHVVHADRGGGLRMQVALDDEVEAGQPVAEIVDVFGDQVQQLTAPVDGFVLRVMRLGSVATGAEVIWIGE